MGDNRMRKMGNSADVSKALEEAHKDNEWIRVHHEELRAQYEGQVFVVKDEKVIASGKSLEAVLEEVKKKDENPLFFVLDSIPPKGLSFIL